MEFFDKICRQIEWEIHAYNANRYSQKRINLFDSKFSKSIEVNNIPKLPEPISKEIKSFWRKYINFDIGTNFHRIAALRIPAELLPYIVCDSVLYPFIVKILNPIKQGSVLENKGLTNALFYDVKQPLIIVRNVNGSFSDNNFELLNKEAAIRMILSYKKPVVFKKSINSLGGRDVIIVRDYDETIIKQQFDVFKKDFVVQEVLQQSEQTAKFNPTSLNTFRVTTLLLNGEFTLLGAWLKCGSKGAEVDNLTSGGMGACVLPDGRLNYAVGLLSPKYEFSPSGVRFEDCRIEHFDRIIEKAKQFHTRIPMVSMAGWDFALDPNDQPVLIEANLRNPDTFPWQTTQGPIFGDRLQEVLDYCFPTSRNV